MGSIKAVLFDLDGTLLDRESAVQAYAGKLHADLGLGCEAKAFVDAFIAGDERGYADKRGMLARLIANFRIKRNAEWIMAHWSKNAWKHISFNDDAGLLLRRLEEDGYRTGLITNGTKKNQRAKLMSLGLEGRLSVTVVSEEVGFAKPLREIFLYAARSLGLEAGECAFVGDNFEKDVIGSTEAGMRGILYDKLGLIDSSGYPAIRDLNEVVDRL